MATSDGVRFIICLSTFSVVADGNRFRQTC